MKTIIWIIAQPFIGILYWLGGFFPRDENRWVFGSALNSFNDNSKHLFAHVIDNEPNIRATWITSNPEVIRHLRSIGAPVVHRWTPTGIWCALRAKYWFYNSYASDINYCASRRACLVNLWHGIPLKKIEFDIDGGVIAERYKRTSLLHRCVFLAPYLTRPDWFLSTSSFVSGYSFSSAFRVAENRCLNFGYPRLDSFFWTEAQRRAWVEKWGSPSLNALMEKSANYGKVYIYMPTWRDHDKTFFSKIGWDLRTLNSQLAESNTLLVLKLHMNTPATELLAARGLSNITILNPKDDIYPLLPATTALITDYSSTFLDYLLLDKPILFFAFDLENYLAESRGMYHSYTDFARGPLVRSTEDVRKFLLTDFPDDYGSERRALRDRLFDHIDGDACRRIIDFMLAREI